MGFLMVGRHNSACPGAWPQTLPDRQGPREPSRVGRATAEISDWTPEAVQQFGLARCALTLRPIREADLWG